MQARKKIDNFLRNRGLGGLDDKNLTHQLAFLVKDHEHFRKILTACEPDKRKMAYEQMRPHLRFEAKPLDVYMAESAEAAERKQLPAYYAADDIRPYKPAEVGEKKLQDKIEEALGAAVIEMQAETKRGRLTVTCRKCIAEASAFVNDRSEGYLALAALGWKFEGEHALCPECNA